MCARQNIALRGHRDDGNLLDDNNAFDTSVARKDGNFRALLKFRVDSGDDVLRQHLESAASNATYISKTTQNELIKAAGDVVRQKILDRIAAARFFTILADETTDASRCEMMSFCVRYVSDNSIREDFLDFIPVYDLTGEGLAKEILSYMTRHSLFANYLIGQGYDGASAMSGKFNGVQATIRRQYECAVYVHCASHCLNLTLSHSCEQQSIRNATGIIQQTATFLNASARRVAMMEQCLDAVPETKRRRVRQLCATRWVERHDAVTSFIALYPAIMRCLEQCADELSDAKAAATARMMLLAIR